jgi:hypothetical protein
MFVCLFDVPLVSLNTPVSRSNDECFGNNACEIRAWTSLPPTDTRYGGTFQSDSEKMGTFFFAFAHPYRSMGAEFVCLCVSVYRYGEDCRKILRGSGMNWRWKQLSLTIVRSMQQMGPHRTWCFTGEIPKRTQH